MSLKLKITIIIVAVLVALFLISVLRVYLYVQKTNVLMKTATPFQRPNPDATQKILVLGDSTAYGTGSESPELTTAGRLASLYPNASVRTVAENGLKLEGLIQKFDQIDPNEKFDIILVQIGANDIIRLTNTKDIETRIDTVVQRLSKQTDNLIIMHSGNVGDSKIWPFYLKPVYTKKSYAVREIYQNIAKKYNIEYVDIIASPIAGIIEGHDDTYYANDYLHLSGAGYGLWFDEIKKHIK